MCHCGHTRGRLPRPELTLKLLDEKGKQVKGEATITITDVSSKIDLGPVEQVQQPPARMHAV